MTNEQPRLTIDKRSPALWVVTFANPPINLIDAAMIGELQQLLTAAETDDRLAVIVFRSKLGLSKYAGKEDGIDRENASFPWRFFSFCSR